MPSPLAHSSLAMCIWPLLKRHTAPSLTHKRKLLLTAVLALWLVLPDFDLLVGPILGRELMHFHNGPSHSLIGAVVMALPFALICRLIARGRLSSYFVVGLITYSSHVLLDAATWGRGVPALWPISEKRITTPLPLFFGVRHSVNAPFSRHLITIVTELAFAAVLYWACRWRRRTASTGETMSAVPPSRTAAHPTSTDAFGEDGSSDGVAS